MFIAFKGKMLGWTVVSVAKENIVIFVRNGRLVCQPPQPCALQYFAGAELPQFDE
jgi:hypothetical protein